MGDAKRLFEILTKPKLALVALLLLSAAIFSPAFKGELFADEGSFAGKFKPFSTEIRHAFSQEEKWDGYFRPVPLLFIMGEYRLASLFPSEKGPDGVYTLAERGVISLVGFTLHALNTLLVFLVCAQLLQGRKNLEWLALCGAAWWGLHPLHAEAVAWRSSQFDLFATFFWLLYLLFALKFITGERLLHCLLASLSLFLAFSSKESAYAAPLTLPALILMLPGEVWSRFLARRALWATTAAATLAPVLAYAAARSYFLDWQFNMPVISSASTFFRLFPGVLAMDLLKLLIPWPQRPFIPEAFGTATAIGLLALFAAALALLLRWKALEKRATLGLAFFLAVTIAPTFIYFMNPAQYGTTIAREAALYAPTLGVAFFIPVALSVATFRNGRARLAATAFGALLLVFCATAFSYSHVFQSKFNFLREAVKEGWGGDRDRWEQIAMGDAYAERGDYDDALRHYSVSLAPENWNRVLPWLAVHYGHLARTKHAEAALGSIMTTPREQREKLDKATELQIYASQTINDLDRADNLYRKVSQNLLPRNMKVLGIATVLAANGRSILSGNPDLAGFRQGIITLEQFLIGESDKSAEELLKYAKSVRTAADLRRL